MIKEIDAMHDMLLKLYLGGFPARDLAQKSSLLQVNATFNTITAQLVEKAYQSNLSNTFIINPLHFFQLPISLNMIFVQGAERCSVYTDWD